MNNLKRTGSVWLTASPFVAMAWGLFCAQGANPVAEARKGFTSIPKRIAKDQEPLAPPYKGLFSLVKYPTDIGPMAAYLGAKPRGSGKHPAILWITGGFPPGGIGESAWSPVDLDNDQSAKQFRLAGFVMMYPTFRGAAGNPGMQETFLGEVDDVLAALKYLKTVPYVDSDQIYLGGHSTGGTLALLAAAATDEFKAVLSYGPVERPSGYGSDVLTYDPKKPREDDLRSPITFLKHIKSPTFVIEGEENGNVDSLREMEKANQNANVRFFPIKGGNHFDVLAPLNGHIAKKFAKLKTSDTPSLTQTELQTEFEAFQTRMREAEDTRTLTALRRKGVSFRTPQTIRHFLYSRKTSNLKRAEAVAKRMKIGTEPIQSDKDEDGDAFHILVLRRQVNLSDKEAVFEFSALVDKFVLKYGAQHGGWDVKRP